jgi:tetratricopeptide (TPR) repeat protein
LAASGPKPDYGKAIQYHMQAVKAADALAADRHPAIRVAAKEVLLDAHLGAAHDIAWGTWKEKEKAVAKWLSLAEGFAQDLVQNEGSSEEHRFRVYTRALAACVRMGGSLDPAKWAELAVRTGEQLIATCDDPLRKSQLQWDLGMALYDALQIYQTRNDHDTALKYGEWAVEYLERSDRQEQSPKNSYLLGRLYFRLGAVYAIRDQNHRVAITWFDKAVPLLEKPTPGTSFKDPGRHGETFVSMGVSYWESGQRERAVALTQRGIKLMNEAVKQGSLEESALAVPYENLASMHRRLGSDEKAERFEEMATKIKGTPLE